MIFKLTKQERFALSLIAAIMVIGLLGLWLL